VLFNSCTSANVTVACTLVGKGDRIFSDRLNHASIIGRCRLKRGRNPNLQQPRPDHLEALLASRIPGRSLSSRRIFSMEGDAAICRG